MIPQRTFTEQELYDIGTEAFPHLHRPPFDFNGHESYVPFVARQLILNEVTNNRPVGLAQSPKWGTIVLGHRKGAGTILYLECRDGASDPECAEEIPDPNAKGPIWSGDRADNITVCHTADGKVQMDFGLWEGSRLTLTMDEAQKLGLGLIGEAALALYVRKG